MDIPTTARRRRFTEAFKAEIVQACTQPGTSVASIACSHGINANQVRRWMREHGVGRALQIDQVTQDNRSPRPVGEFLPVRVEHPAPDTSSIQIEVRRANTTIKLSWPASSAAACSHWLKDWLR